MKSIFLHGTTDKDRRQWLVDVTAYDRRPQLTEEEYATLTMMRERFQTGVIQWRGEWRTALKRLLIPLYTVVNRHKTNTRNIGNVHVLLKEMHQRQTSFWAWSDAEWREIIGADQQQFRQRHGNTTSSRMMVVAVNYLLCGVNEIGVLSSIEAFLFAKKVFGVPKVEESLQQVLGHMEDHLGYTPSHVIGIRNLLCLVLVYNRSPTISDITLEVLTTLQKAPLHLYLKESLLVLSRLLASLGVVPRSLPSYYPKDWGLGGFDRLTLPYHGDHTHISGGEEQIADLVISEHLSPGSCAPSPSRWQWPLDAAVYDRTPQLTEMEQAELALMMDRFTRGILPWRKASRDILHRLLHPMYDVFQVMDTKTRSYSGITHVFIEEMHHRQTSFWAWSEAEWLETIGQHEGDFLQRHSGKKNDAFRQSLAAVGYLLCQFNAFTLVDRIYPYPLACKVFGTTHVDHAVQLIHRTLAGWGYATACHSGSFRIPTW